MSLLPNEDDSLGTSVTKNFALSTITTIGVLTGTLVFGYVWNKVETRNKKRQAKKDAK